MGEMANGYLGIIYKKQTSLAFIYFLATEGFNK